MKGSDGRVQFRGFKDEDQHGMYPLEKRHERKSDLKSKVTWQDLRGSSPLFSPIVLWEYKSKTTIPTWKIQHISSNYKILMILSSIITLHTCHTYIALLYRQVGGQGNKQSGNTKEDIWQKSLSNKHDTQEQAKQKMWVTQHLARQ